MREAPQAFVSGSVSGTRMSLLAGKILGLELPRADKLLLVIAETDGWTGHVGCSTLRILDFGKFAATFVDIHSGMQFEGENTL